MLELKVSNIRLDVRTRAQRRRAIHAVIKQLADIRAAEVKYLDNVPANLSNSHNCVVGHEAVESIEFALHMLSDAYDTDHSRSDSDFSLSVDFPF